MWGDLFTKQFAFNTDRDVSLHLNKLKQHLMHIFDRNFGSVYRRFSYTCMCKILGIHSKTHQIINQLTSFLTQQTSLLPPKVWWPSTGTTDGEWHVPTDISTGWIWVRWIGFFLILEL